MNELKGRTKKFSLTIFEIYNQILVVERHPQVDYWCFPLLAPVAVICLDCGVQVLGLLIFSPFWFGTASLGDVFFFLPCLAFNLLKMANRAFPSRPVSVRALSKWRWS